MREIASRTRAMCLYGWHGPHAKSLKASLRARPAQIRASSLRCARKRANALRCSKTLPAFLSSPRDALLFGPCQPHVSMRRRF